MPGASFDTYDLILVAAMMMLEASKSFKVGLEHLTCDLCSTNSADILVLIPTVVLAMYFDLLSRFLEG